MENAVGEVNKMKSLCTMQQQCTAYIICKYKDNLLLHHSLDASSVGMSGISNFYLHSTKCYLYTLDALYLSEKKTTF